MNNENEKGVEMIKAAQRVGFEPSSRFKNLITGRVGPAREMLPAAHSTAFCSSLPPIPSFPSSLLPLPPLGTGCTSIRQSQHVENSHGLSISLIRDGIRARSMKQY